MAAAKEIRTKIASVKSTQKITSAMQMVAASKMKKTQNKMAKSRPYAHMMRRVIRHISENSVSLNNCYLKKRDVHNIGYIIVSTDRGLCGGLNINIFKDLLKSITDNHEKGIGVSLAIIGSKANSFFSKISSCNIKIAKSNLSDNPKLSDLIGLVKFMREEYENNKIDKLVIVYNEFVNSMVQRVKTRVLLPIEDLGQNDKKKLGDYIYESEPEKLMNSLIIRYIESQVYQAVVENLACEQAARMMAMKSASENAEAVISDLQLVYNKARQAGITQELTEIVSGAAAV